MKISEEDTEKIDQVGEALCKLLDEAKLPPIIQIGILQIMMLKILEPEPNPKVMVFNLGKRGD